MKTIAERLTWARERLGLSQRSLADKAGVRQSTIGNIESGARHHPRNLLAIASAVQVRPEWLESGRGPVEPQQVAEPYRPYEGVNPYVVQSTPIDLKTLSTIPVVQWREIMLAPKSLPEVFKVAVPDDAMYPRVKRGQHVEINRTLEAEPGDGVLIRDKTGTLYLRQYHARAGTQWTAHALNSAYEPLDSERDGLVVIGVVTATEARWS